jgi:colanic acid/amylovoran biosynthesis glycosyltransferase
MGDPKNINVGHFRTPFLSHSETFIYTYLIHAVFPIRPFVFTSQVVNQDAFPFDRIIRYPVPRFTGWDVVSHSWHPHEVFLRHAFRKNQIALLHAHFGPEGWALANLKKSLNLPMVTTFYGYDASYLAGQPLWRDRYRQLFAAGDLFLAEGPVLRKRLEALGCPTGKVDIQPIAVPVDRISWRMRQPARHDPRLFLFCGRFVEKKGLIYALRAFKALLDEGCDGFEFRVIGDGKEMTTIREFVVEQGLGRHVKLLGLLSHSDFYRELSRAEVLVAPSVTSDSGDTEGGAPTTILEAQAAGLAIVATRHADIPFVVSEGESALLAPERDVQALQTHLRFFVEHPETLASFGRAGRSFVERRHDIRIEARKMQARYSSLF